MVVSKIKTTGASIYRCGYYTSSMHVYWNIQQKSKPNIRNFW